MKENLLSSKDEALENAGQRINGLFSHYCGSPLLFLTSGGGAINILNFIDAGLIAENTTISVLDERAYDDENINNFAQMCNMNFYDNALKSGCNFIDTRIREWEDFNELAERFEVLLRAWRNKNPLGKIIATMGIGQDGHISGIMPYPDNKAVFDSRFNNEDFWVMGYDAKEKNQYPLRVTTTLPLIRLFNHAVVFVSGQKKRSIVEKIREGSKPYHILPASILNEIDSDIFWGEK